MPKYKKKKVNRFAAFTKPQKKQALNIQQEEDIVMNSSKVKRSTSAVSQPSRFRIVRGKKLERRKKYGIMLSAVAVLTAVCALVSYLLPVGIIENVTNLFCSFGSGSYPIEITGSKTLNSDSRSNCYYVLTDTSLFAFNNSGKEIYKKAHGYANPVLKTSETRALVFDQGTGNLEIYNFQRTVNSFSDENAEIITAAISKNGIYAIVTRSGSYASTVTVYDRKGKEIYKWNSAKDIVNSVAIAPSGKKIAVSTLNSQNGVAQSKVRILEFDSADAVASFDITDGAVRSLETFGKGFFILTKHGCGFVKWSKYAKTDNNSELELAMFRRCNGGAVAVFNRSSDESDNLIMLISPKGEKITEFEFKGIISDIQYKSNHIYCVSDTSAFSYNKEGQLLQTGECNYGCKRISAIGNDKLAVITDSDISVSELTKE